MDKILNGVISNAEKANSQMSEDYKGTDGLLYCGKCHTPKQYRITFRGEEMNVPCMCECRSAEKSREQAELNAQKERERIEFNRQMAFTDMRSSGCVFSRDDSPHKDTSKLARNYAAAFNPQESHGFLFFGNCGTGKSFIAACICNAVIDKGFTARFTNMTELSNELWDSGNGKSQVYKRIAGYDLLVIDDFSTERNTAYMQEIVFSVIDARYRSGKPLIVTTNLSPSEISNPQDISQNRIYSRIYDLCIPVKFDGNDRRKQKMMSAREEISRLLHYGEV